MKNVNLNARWVNTIWHCGRMRNLRWDDFKLIKEAYDAPGRNCHNLGYLEYCFSVFDKKFPRSRRQAALDLAIWFSYFHIGPSVSLDQNKEKNAKLAKNFVIDRAKECDFELSSLVENLILCTKSNASPHNRVSEVIIDMDRAILAADQETFDKYEDNLRKEYINNGVLFVSYLCNRLTFFHKLLSKKRLFYTSELKDLDPLARSNINRTIMRLESM